MLQRWSAPRFQRRENLFFWMHVLRSLRRERSWRSVPELRWRVARAAAAPCWKAAHSPGVGPEGLQTGGMPFASAEQMTRTRPRARHGGALSRVPGTKAKESRWPKLIPSHSWRDWGSSARRAKSCVKPGLPAARYIVGQSPLRAWKHGHSSISLPNTAAPWFRAGSSLRPSLLTGWRRILARGIMTPRSGPLTDSGSTRLSMQPGGPRPKRYPIPARI